MVAMLLHEDRLFPAEASARKVARSLYEHVRGLPIISPHGHTQAAWFADNGPFPDPATLFVQPDHYVFRMLYSQGISMDDLGIGQATIQDPRKVWRIFAKNYYLFRGTPTRMWLDFAFQELFGFKERLSEQTADLYFDTIAEKLHTPEFLPRALYERFNIEVLSTTESALDPLKAHQAIRDSGWKARIVPAFRPDQVVDPEFKGFAGLVAQLGEQNGEDSATWKGYLNCAQEGAGAIQSAGLHFDRSWTSDGTDGGLAAERSGSAVRKGDRGQSGCGRAGVVPRSDADRDGADERGRWFSDADSSGIGAQPQPFCGERYGRDMGADIPRPTNYVDALRPLLDRFGNERNLTIILFTLDETTYSRELAPLAGHYPCLRLGPPWWFHDSPEGMMRFREQATETAGFYNTVGFNDDTRAFLSIPARHDVARRVDCAFLGRLVAEHRLDEDEAHEVAHQLTYELVKKAYRL